MQIFLGDQILELTGINTVKDLLENLNFAPSTVIVIRDEKVLLEEDKLSEEDEVRILKVIAGG